MALYFDGVDDYVDCGNENNLDITDEITATAWINKNSSTDYAGVVEKGKGNEGGYLLGEHASGTVQFRIFITDDSKVATSPSALSTDAWHHIVGVYNKTNVSIFVDGVETVGDAYSGSITVSAHNLYIGYDDFNIARHFDGTIDDARIYSRALSADEIKSIYHSRGADNIVNGLVGRWLMNEKGVGQTATVASSIKDMSSGGNHGSPSGSPVYAGSELKIIRPQMIVLFEEDTIVSCQDAGAGSEIITFGEKEFLIQDDGSGVEVLIKNLFDAGVAVEQVIFEDKEFVIVDVGEGEESFLHAWDEIIIIG